MTTKISERKTIETRGSYCVLTVHLYDGVQDSSVRVEWRDIANHGNRQMVIGFENLRDMLGTFSELRTILEQSDE